MASSVMRSIPQTRRRTEVRSLSVPAGFTIALVAIALISLLYLAQTSAVATTGYDIKRLEDQKTQWEMKNEQLRMKIAQLRSLQRVEAEAGSRLKMGPPEKVIFVPVERKETGTDSRLLPDSSAHAISGGVKDSEGSGKPRR